MAPSIAERSGSGSQSKPCSAGYSTNVWCPAGVEARLPSSRAPSLLTTTSSAATRHRKGTRTSSSVSCLQGGGGSALASAGGVHDHRSVPGAGARRDARGAVVAVHCVEAHVRAASSRQAEAEASRSIPLYVSSSSSHSRRRSQSRYWFDAEVAEEGMAAREGAMQAAAARTRRSHSELSSMSMGASRTTPATPGDRRETASAMAPPIDEPIRKRGSDR
eukprot:scaffold11238_cov114-Isochrysis_galbana.AAC.3